ncbi:MAG: hypothetical protein H7067_20045 [Burkholderiales bacterium]|nr:hypothetical protein [Opitutaceae bacterium]
MNTDYANQGVLNENHWGSAAFTRERLRRGAIFRRESPVPAPGMPSGPDVVAAEEPDLSGLPRVESASGAPPSV